MRRRLERDPRPPRSLRRHGDGTLYDLDEQRTITLAELAEDVRVGRRFKAYQQGSERDCTQQVLLQVLGRVGPGQAGPLQAASHLHGLAGAVGAIAGVIADRREPGGGADGDGDRAVLGRRRSGSGTGRRPRPRLEIDEESDA